MQYQYSQGQSGAYRGRVELTGAEWSSQGQSGAFHRGRVELTGAEWSFSQGQSGAHRGRVELFTGAEWSSQGQSGFNTCSPVILDADRSIGGRLGAAYTS